MKRVLVLAGGGARGLMQLHFLARLEQEEGKKISDMFDLICGTSVGAISASILASGISANELYPIFKDGLPEIFESTWWNLKGLFKPLYDRKNFNKIWCKLLPKEKLLSSAEVDLMITAVDRVDDTNHYFRSWSPKYSDMQIRWAVMASFAAPYYFGQLKDKLRKAIWFDGGVGLANLPVDQAYTEIIKRGWLKKEKVVLTCLGTGKERKVDRDKEYNKLKDEKLKKQITDFLNPSEGGLARKQSLKDQISRYTIIANNTKNLEFRYIDAKASSSLDDIKPKTIDMLERAGKAMWKLNKLKKWKWK